MRRLKVVFCFVGLLSILGFGLLSQNLFPLVTASSFDNVQIAIQTSGLQTNYFVVDAFNMSGHLEASTETNYAAASFELPNAQYIFTVTANSNYYYPVPLMGAASSAASSPSGVASSGPVSSSEPSLPIYVAPAVEYGYSVQQVFSSTSITITTQNVSAYPTNSLSIMVSYENGTAASGAYVSASVLGSWYYWGYNSNVTTWGVTGSDGVAKLVVPTAPVIVDAWIWVQYKAMNYSAPQAGAPSQVVNGSVIAYPIYLGLAGLAIVIPPQTSATITLHPQPVNYWVSPSVGSATPSLASASSYSAGPGSVPYSVYEQQQGNPNLANLMVPVSTTSQPTETPSPSTQTATPTASPTPSSSATASPTAAVSSTPTPAIPEFPLVIIDVAFIFVASAVLSFRKRKSLH